MALTFSIDKPEGSGVSKGYTFLNFKTEQQYFEIDYSGAAANDVIKIEEQQDGTNWTTLASITISSSGSGTIKDLVGDFKLNGNLIRVVAENSSGNTTYLTRTYTTNTANDGVKKDFARQVDDLFIHQKKSNITNKASFIYRPAFNEALSLVNNEDNSVITSTSLSSNINMSSYNLDCLPVNLQMAIRSNPSRVFINGINIKSFPQSSNSDFHGNGNLVTPTDKPFFVAAGKVHLFAADNNDNGLSAGTKFLKVLKASMGKRLYHAERMLATNGLTKSIYLNQKTVYNTIASSKVTELF